MNMCGDSSYGLCTVDETVGAAAVPNVAERGDRVMVEFAAEHGGPTTNGNINVFTGKEGNRKQWTVPDEANLYVLEKAPKPLPPEPVVGSVVRAGGQNFMRIRYAFPPTMDWVTDCGTMWSWKWVVKAARKVGEEPVTLDVPLVLPSIADVPDTVSYQGCCKSQPPFEMQFDGWMGKRVYIGVKGASTPCYLSDDKARDLAKNILAVVGVK